MSDTKPVKKNLQPTTHAGQGSILLGLAVFFKDVPINGFWEAVNKMMVSDFIIWVIIPIVAGIGLIIHDEEKR